MLVETKLAQLGLTLPDLDQHYRGNASGARFISHLAVGNMLCSTAYSDFGEGATYQSTRLDARAPA